MKRMKILLALCTVLMVVASMSAASAAIVVDGVKSAGEWDEDWAFDQNKAAHPYDINNLGDRMEILQSGVYLTDDPIADAGSFNNEDMAQIGPNPSGYDIHLVYAHYDPATDTLYGMATAYGNPGDLVGNGDPIDEAGIVPPATGGPVGLGIGPDEFFDIDIIQAGVNTVGVRIQDDDWTTDGVLAVGDVDAKFTSGLANSVYEISISDFSTYFDLNICAEKIIIVVEAGAINDNLPGQGSPGEDQVTVEINAPCPEIEIVKYVKDNVGTWQDANGALTENLNLTDINPVEFRYVVTNIGDEPLVNVAVTDDQIGPIVCPQDTLDIGESMECFATDDNRCPTVVDGVTPGFVNWGDVVGTGVVSGMEVTDEDPAKYFCGGEIPVPAMTPVGLFGLIGMLGMIGIVALRRRD